MVHCSFTSVNIKEQDFSASSAQFWNPMSDVCVATDQALELSSVAESRVPPEPFPQRRLGIVGCGYILRDVYSPILKSVSKDARIVAVCDINETAAHEAANSLDASEVYLEPKRFFEKADIDGVLVLTKEIANAQIAAMALAQGINVYLEKPPAVSLPELRSLIAAESRSEAVVYTAFNRRHTPLFKRMPDLDARITRVSGTLKRTGREEESFPYTAIHIVDSAQHFVQSELMEAEVKCKRDTCGLTWTIEGRFGNGAACLLTASPNASIHEEYLIIESDRSRRRLHFPHPLDHFPGGAIFSESFDLEAGSELFGQPSSKTFVMGYSDCLFEFLRALRENTLKYSPHRLSRALASVSVMQKMFAANGAILDLA